MSNTGINLVEHLKFYKDFPKAGINFIDIMPLMSSKEVFSQVINELDAAVHCPNLALPEARGFLFGAPLLLTDGAVTNIIPVRKSGKLPFAEGDLTGVDIMKEYGADRIFYRNSDIASGELSGDVFEIAILDDILATGGTAEALALSLNGKTVIKDGIPHRVVVKQFVFLVEIDDLNGSSRLEKIAPVTSLIHLND
ncbi:MAG: hypothetical protein ACI39U_02175 [Candidatus Cryptobacteroides sp.]